MPFMIKVSVVSIMIIALIVLLGLHVVTFITSMESEVYLLTINLCFFNIYGCALLINLFFFDGRVGNLRQDNCASIAEASCRPIRQMNSYNVIATLDIRIAVAAATASSKNSYKKRTQLCSDRIVRKREGHHWLPSERFVQRPIVSLIEYDSTSRSRS